MQYTHPLDKATQPDPRPQKNWPQNFLSTPLHVEIKGRIAPILKKHRAPITIIQPKFISLRRLEKAISSLDDVGTRNGEAFFKLRQNMDNNDLSINVT